jgi:hypothetical protein
MPNKNSFKNNIIGKIAAAQAPSPCSNVVTNAFNAPLIGVKYGAKTAESA